MIQNTSNFRNNKKFRDAIKILDEGLKYSNPKVGLTQYFLETRLKLKNP